MSIIKYCEHCKHSKQNTSIYKLFLTNVDVNKIDNFFAGYIGGIEDSYWNKTNNCPFCDNLTQDTNLNLQEVLIVGKCSNYNPALLDAMRELKEKDVIEYELKMSQFRNQANQMDAMRQQKREDNRPRCPHCNSTNIQSIGIGERIGSVMMFGMFSKKMNKSFKCLDCKYTW